MCILFSQQLNFSFSYLLISEYIYFMCCNFDIENDVKMWGSSTDIQNL